MMSLQQRLGLTIGLGLALVLVVIWFAVGWSALRISESYVAARLEHDAEGLLSALTVVDGEPQVAAAVTPAYLRPFSGHYFIVEGGGVQLRSRSLWDFNLKLPLPPASGEVQTFRVKGPERQPLLVYRRSYSRQGVPLVVAVAEDLTDLQSRILTFQRILALVAVLALATLLTGQWLVVRRGLAPLDRLRKDVSRLEQGEVSSLAESVPTEVVPLVREINHLLQVTARRLERSRHALGDLAHALKTPLSVIQNTADRSGEEMSDAVRHQVLTEAARIRELVERELKRARLAGSASPGKHFIPGEEIPHLVRAIEGIYGARGIRVEWSVPKGKRFTGDRDDMLEMLGNLFDNAGKWARSRVRVVVADAPGLVLTVEDDGPGVPDETLALLTQRGVRLDESTPGTGLGLSIVRAVVDDYRGELLLGRSPDLGGFLAEVRLPAPN